MLVLMIIFRIPLSPQIVRAGRTAPRRKAAAERIDCHKRNDEGKRGNPAIPEQDAADRWPRGEAR